MRTVRAKVVAKANNPATMVAGMANVRTMVSKATWETVATEAGTDMFQIGPFLIPDAISAVASTSASTAPNLRKTLTSALVKVVVATFTHPRNVLRLKPKRDSGSRMVGIFRSILGMLRRINRPRRRPTTEET